MNYKHGGNLRELAGKIGLSESDICDFSANINPLGPPDWLRSVISRAVDSVVNYPDPNCKKLVKTIADNYNIVKEEILVANLFNEFFGANGKSQSNTSNRIELGHRPKYDYISWPT